MDRALIKREYKESRRPMGVYQIKNLENGKLLVGSSLNLPSIFNRHLFELKHGSHRNEDLQQEWNRFGQTSFSFDVLEEYDPKEDDRRVWGKQLEVLEAKWLNHLQPYGNRGYNKPPAKDVIGKL